MTLGPLAFAVVIWGAVFLALGVFAYEVYALLKGWGWIGGGEGGRPSG